MSAFLQYTLSGIISGSIYALIALGFTIIYKSTNIINFAQGEFVVLGGLLAVFFSERLHLPLVLNILFSVAIVGCISFLLEFAAIRPCKKKNANLLTLIIVTIGAAILLRGLSMAIFWKDPGKRFPPFTSNATINIGGAYIITQDIWIFAVTLVTLLLVMIFFEHTITGKSMRACASHKKAAQLMGINVEKMTSMTFILSGILGAVAGIVITPKLGMSYDSGVYWGIKGFCAAVLGSMGNLMGAVICGIFLGLIEAYVTGYGDVATLHLIQVSNYRELIVIFLMLVVLLVKPAGLFAGKETSRV
ncbi:MAG: branched-chain amino acid ABC transporter permease [Candidatus Aureabacteria bacterium]|nr:branched-chain amino acid ABC transporter permease [Candidatus Auribacterota bacterium]